MNNVEPGTAEKIRIFSGLFTGLKSVYGTYDTSTGRVRQEKAAVTEEVILAHLRGKQPYGVYLLVQDKTKALAVDFDRDDIGPALAFVDAAYEYGIFAYIERSKSKGYHAWIFLTEGGVSARKARLAAKRILGNIECEDVEIFPKQDALTGQRTYGNFINAPLFGALVGQGRTVFLDVTAYGTPYADQWAFLQSVERTSEAQLDEIIADQQRDPESAVPAHNASPGSRVDNGKTHFSLPACARHMLTEGVSGYQRVVCFRLAVGLKRAGLPYDIAVSALKTWARKNHPPADKEIITVPEIVSQASCAYSKDYRGYGCEEPGVRPYCDPACPVNKNSEK